MDTKLGFTGTGKGDPLKCGTAAGSPWKKVRKKGPKQENHWKSFYDYYYFSVPAQKIHSNFYWPCHENQLPDCQTAKLWLSILELFIKLSWPDTLTGTLLAWDKRDSLTLGSLKKIKNKKKISLFLLVRSWRINHELIITANNALITEYKAAPIRLAIAS